MATIGRQITRSFVCQLRQPKWNRLLPKSNKKLHFVAINQQRSFSKDSDNKDCIDYKEKPWIEGHVPTPFPPKKEALPKFKIKRKRECKQRKKCKKMAKKEAEKCTDDPSANFTGARGSLLWQKVNGFLWYLSQLGIPVPEQVHLNQVRNFCKPVSRRSQRIVRKRKHLLAKKIMAEAEAKVDAKAEAQADVKAEARADVKAKAKADAKAEAEADAKAEAEADAKAEAEADAKVDAKADAQSQAANPNLDQAFVQLKKASILNSRNEEWMQKQFQDAFEDLKIPKDQGEERLTDNLIKNMIINFMKACAHHAQKSVRDSEEENRLRQAIKDKCQKKREEFQKHRKPESKKIAKKEKALKKVNKVAQLQKLCEEAKENHAYKIAKIHMLYEKAKLKKQSMEAAPRERKRETATISKKQKDIKSTDSE